MKRPLARLAAIACVSLVIGAGCYRTRYVNLSPQLAAPPPAAAPAPEAPSRWQHFFLFGWVPGERRFDVAKACGGAEHLERIETRKTFVQGLVTALTSFYINVYSPYTGWIVCDRGPE
jgi:hypothetical protein